MYVSGRNAASMYQGNYSELSTCELAMHAPSDPLLLRQEIIAFYLGVILGSEGWRSPWNLGVADGRGRHPT
jgi:hypothetical protein